MGRKGCGSSNYSETIGSKGEIWNFFVARFARLYPLYFVFLCADLLTRYGLHSLSSHRAIALPFYLTFTQSWFYLPIDGNSLIYQFGQAPSVSWSISTEWFFYFAFPVICLALARLKTSRQIAFTAAVFCLMALGALTIMNLHIGDIFTYGQNRYGPIGANLQDGFYRWIAYFSPYVRVLEFVLGCFVSALTKGLQTPSKREQELSVWFVSLSILSVLVLQWEMFGRAAPVSLIQHLHMNFGFAPCAAALIFCCARYENPIVRALSSRKIVLLGECSYSIYLSHTLIIGAFSSQASAINDVAGWMPAIILVGLTLASILGASLILWAVIEMPARRALRRWLTIKDRSDLRAQQPQVA